MKTKILEHVRNVCGLKKYTIVQLNDLLLTACICDVSLNISQLGEIFCIENGERNYKGIIDLAKTVEQNLENKRVCKLLFEVLNIK